MLRLRGQMHCASAQVPGTLLKFRKGEVVYAQGDPATDWYEVVLGTVRTCYLYASGHRQLTGFYYPGDVFGIEAGAHEGSAEAVTNATLRRIDRNGRKDQVLFRPTESNQGPTDHIEQATTSASKSALESALRNAQDCIFLLGHRTAAERMATFLLTTSRRIGQDKPFQLPMSRSDIADYLGLTIHTVSRTLSEFVRRGLISLNGPQSMTIADRAGLSALEGRDDDEEMQGFNTDFAVLAQRNTTGMTHHIGR